MVSFVLAGAVFWIGVRANGQAPIASVNAGPNVDWSSYVRDASEAHYSPLKQVDSSNAARLGVPAENPVGFGTVELTLIVI